MDRAMDKTKIKTKLNFEPSVQALARWNPAIEAAAKADETTFNIYSTIGDTWDGTGVTPDKLASFLSKADGKDVVININSAGGDFFDGLAMHTMLSEYEGGVTIKVVGLAASAASMIAMAGDKIQMAESAMMMIHNAWTFAMGNKNDMTEAAQVLDKFDDAMSKLYAKKSGMKTSAVRSMMDEETWLDGADAVEKGFADSVLGEKEVVENKTNSEYNSALRKLDVTLARSGMTRTERRELLAEVKKNSSTPSAAEKVTPSADEITAALEGLLKTIKG